MMKWIKGYKTMGFGGLLTILGMIQQSDIWQVLPPQYAGIGMSTIGLIIMILRSITTTPVGSDTPTPTPDQIVEAVKKEMMEAQKVVGAVQAGVVEGSKPTLVQGVSHEPIDHK